LPAKSPRQPPQRTCVACRTTGDKRQLVRVVRTPSDVEVDPSGKKPGRGAYLCHNPACWQAALQKGRLDAALKRKLTADDRLRLAEYATRLGAVAV
jgi:predicted RNA-binding protein YlxR (DUF448 family)